MFNYIRGFPRSGNTWVRYIIQAFTTAIVHKNHEYKNMFSINNVLIFCIRNYKECITRHKRARTFEDFEKPLSNYMKLLNMFDSFKGTQKIIVYYEDLMDDPKTIIPSFTRFFDERFNYDFDCFMENYELHQQESLKVYKQYTGSSHEEKDWKPEHTIVHSEHLTKEVKMTLDNYLIVNHSELSKKYLKRYYD